MSSSTIFFTAGIGDEQHGLFGTLKVNPSSVPPPAGPTMADASLSVSTVVSSLEQPTSMVFLGPNDFLVLEKATGKVQHVVNGVIANTALDLAVNSASERGLLTTVAWQLDGTTTYALEGSVFVAGAVVQWLRDGLGIISRADESQALAESVPDTGGLSLVPAFTGLGAPYWDPYARGVLIGITRGTSRAHIARAALEAIAFQSRDVLDTMALEAGVPIRTLRVDGGAAANDFLCRFQADVLDVEVLRPAMTETTALGAASLAGVGAGMWKTSDLAGRWRLERRFVPTMSPDARETAYARWRRAVEHARDWADH